MTTIQEVLKSFKGRTVTADTVDELIKTVNDWGEANNYSIYPISVGEVSTTQEAKDGMVTINVTFEYKPK